MKLLLNSHIGAAVARRLRAAGVEAVALPEWNDGNHRTASDDDILTAALAESRVLVTYDCRTIPPLLKLLAETGRHHAGVILVDEQTIRPSDIGGLVRALRAVAASFPAGDWEDRVIFLS